MIIIRKSRGIRAQSENTVIRKTDTNTQSIGPPSRGKDQDNTIQEIKRMRDNKENKRKHLLNESTRCGVVRCGAVRCLGVEYCCLDNLCGDDVRVHVRCRSSVLHISLILELRLTWNADGRSAVRNAV